MSPWYWKSIRSILSRPDSHRRLLAATELHPQKKPFPWTTTPKKKRRGNAEVTKKHGWFAPPRRVRARRSARMMPQGHQETKGLSEQAYGGGKGRSETWWKHGGHKDSSRSFQVEVQLLVWGNWCFGSLLSHNPQVRSWLFNVSPPTTPLFFVDKGLIQTFSLMLDKAAGYVCRVALNQILTKLCLINQPP